MGPKSLCLILIQALVVLPVYADTGIFAPSNANEQFVATPSKQKSAMSTPLKTANISTLTTSQKMTTAVTTGMAPISGNTGALPTAGLPVGGAPNYSVNSQPQTISQQIQAARYQAWLKEQQLLQQQQMSALPPPSTGNTNSPNGSPSNSPSMPNGGGNNGGNGTGNNSSNRQYQKYDSSFGDSGKAKDYSPYVRGDQTLSGDSCAAKPAGRGEAQDYKCLVCNCFYEAEHGSKYGNTAQIFAGEVEVNRTVYTRAKMNRSEWGGSNLCDVVWAETRNRRGGLTPQFSWTHENKKATPMGAKPGDRAALNSCKDAAKAAQVVKANGLPNYHAVWMNPGWSNLTPRERLAGHQFYSDDNLRSMAYADPLPTPSTYQAVASAGTSQ